MFINVLKKKFEKRLRDFCKSIYDYLPIGPFFATFLAMFANLLIAYCIYVENYYGIVLFFFLHVFFDILDGNIARLIKKETKFGAFLDLFSDHIIRNIWYVAAAFALLISWPLALSCIVLRLLGFSIVILAEKIGLKGKKYFVVNGGVEVLFLLGIVIQQAVLVAKMSLILNFLVIVFDLVMIFYFNWKE
jgi:phosphatidylglycerophosphate synthase